MHHYFTSIPRRMQGNFPIQPQTVLRWRHSNQMRYFKKLWNRDFLPMLQGSAFSALFPMYLVFTLGNALTVIPMAYLCFHKNTRTEK